MDGMSEQRRGAGTESGICTIVDGLRGWTTLVKFYALQIYHDEPRTVRRWSSSKVSVSIVPRLETYCGVDDETETAYSDHYAE